MDAESRPKWERLGRLLIERRARLDPRYTVRTAFAEAVGINFGLIRDIEKADRDTFRPENLSAIEKAYGWAPGSVERVLAGGNPVELPEAAGAVRTGMPPMQAKVRAEVDADHERVRTALVELASRLPPEEIRAILEGLDVDRPRQEPAPPPPVYVEMDAALMAVWTQLQQVDGLTDNERQMLISFLQSVRGLAAQPPRQATPQESGESGQRPGFAS